MLDILPYILLIYIHQCPKKGYYEKDLPNANHLTAYHVVILNYFHLLHSFVGLGFGHFHFGEFSFE